MASPLTPCSRCLLRDDWPGLEFDGMGVCDLCRGYERRWGPWLTDARERDRSRRRLEQESTRAKRRKRGEFDCLVPITGGKDSLEVLRTMVVDYGLRVLCYTYDNGLLAEEAIDNIQIAIGKLGVPHLFDHHPFQHDLMRHFLLRTGNFCGACVTPYLLGSYRAAKHHGIPLIAFGLSRRTDANGPDGMNPFHFLNVVRDGFGTDRLVGLWDGHPMLSYLLDSVLGHVRVINLPDYLMWEKYGNASKLEDLWGMTIGEEHTDCIGHELADWLMYRRYGFGFDIVKQSQLIRHGLVSRETAAGLVATSSGNRKMPASARGFAARVGVSLHEIESCAGKPFRQYYRGIGNHLAVWMRNRYFAR